jgi:hypothetical protein
MRVFPSASDGMLPDTVISMESDGAGLFLHEKIDNKKIQVSRGNAFTISGVLLTIKVGLFL